MLGTGGAAAGNSSIWSRISSSVIPDRFWNRRLTRELTLSGPDEAKGLPRVITWRTRSGNSWARIRANTPPRLCPTMETLPSVRLEHRLEAHAELACCSSTLPVF